MMNDEVCRGVDAILLAATEAEVTPALNEFVHMIRELALDAEALHSGEGRGFLRATVGPLIQARAAFGALISDAEVLAMREFHGAEWHVLCERRSEIEWIRSCYRELANVDWAIFMNVDTLDELIRQRGTAEGGISPLQIPRDIPPVHWWWWYPAMPPAAR